MKDEKYKIIAIERGIEQEKFCPICEIGILNLIDPKHYKCTYCNGFFKFEEINNAEK